MSKYQFVDNTPSSSKRNKNGQVQIHYGTNMNTLQMQGGVVMVEQNRGCCSGLNLCAKIILYSMGLVWLLSIIFIIIAIIKLLSCASNLANSKNKSSVQANDCVTSYTFFVLFYIFISVSIIMSIVSCVTCCCACGCLKSQNGVIIPVTTGVII